MTARSGTNWLHGLITSHPDCKKGLGWEDYFIHSSNHIFEYINELKSKWRQDWPLSERQAELYILKEFGNILNKTLEFSNEKENRCRKSNTKLDRTGGIIVSKTPSVRNIERFFDIFPESYLIILVRDGRSVAESGMRAFDWSLYQSAKYWSNAAESVIRFSESSNSPKKYEIIKYEDLYKDTILVLKKLFNFVGIDGSKYNFESSLDYPVIGSSKYGSRPGDINWGPTEKSENFSPLERWKKWSSKKHDLFNYIAKKELKKLGYKPVNKSNYVRRKARYKYWNIAEYTRRKLYDIKRCYSILS